MASIFTACDVLQQAEKMANLTKCEFRLGSVTNLKLAGINVQNAKAVKDLSLMDAQRLLTAVAANSFPLTFTLNVDVRNPNTSAAGLSKMDWILFIDDIQMLSGAVNQQVTIPAKGIKAIPVNASVDLKKVLKGKTADAIINFGLNLASAGNKPTRMMMQLKPTIMIGSYPLSYPGYLTVKTVFTSR
ncbi:MAG: LEA type 2 family protein [Lentimicrobiaceae bacterium]|nr:LEA type 2 family protein [Lentimicrobiaceae bacterium]